MYVFMHHASCIIKAKGKKMFVAGLLNLDAHGKHTPSFENRHHPFGVELRYANQACLENQGYVKLQDKNQS